MANILDPDNLHSLAAALVETSYEPLLLVDRSFRIVAASTSFHQAFQLAPSSIIGRPLASIGDGEWAAPQLQSLLEATAAGRGDIGGYAMELARDGRAIRQLVLHARKLEYGNPETVVLSLAISDVTQARTIERLKETLVHEKAILLQELQHRVANSLQIIASVLMQSSRRVQSEESRVHLHDAHHRVMSVAAMQRQLAVSQQGDVMLRPYFEGLCRSIGASMIRDPEQLKLDCCADDSVTSADRSVSMGLIVTELVINALKHAFPEHRSGNITVQYVSDGPNWVLSVCDNGVGMPPNYNSKKAGLGTNIIAALANKLDASVITSDAKPGTLVKIIRSDDGIGLK